MLLVSWLTMLLVCQLQPGYKLQLFSGGFYLKHLQLIRLKQGAYTKYGKLFGGYFFGINKHFKHVGDNRFGFLCFPNTFQCQISPQLITRAPLYSL